MRIAIDRQSLGGKKTGYGFYLFNLLKEMEKIKGRHELVYIDDVKENLSTPRRIWWDQVGLPRAAKKKRADILFVPSFSCPIFYKGKKVVTAHDLIGKIFSKNFSYPAKLYWSKLLPYSFTKADHVITVSENSKKDLMKYLNISETKITVIYEGAGPQFQPLGKQTTSNPFILSVSTIEPRKNYKRLVQAFAQIERKDVELVIVGKKAWGFEELAEEIRKLKIKDRVKFIDYIGTEQLVRLYNDCLLFAMVSLYEGFGLPAVEAMACGAPVLVSNTSSLPEVVGEAGILVNPNDVSGMAFEMNEILGNEEMRKKMAEKSLMQATKFSWEKAARETMEVLKNVYNS